MRRPATTTPPGLAAFEPPPADGSCRFVGCPNPATHAHRGKYGRRWWLGCPTHHADMQSALFIGQPSDSGQVTTLRLGAH